MEHANKKLLSLSIIRQAMLTSFVKLSPWQQIRNPVMFTVYIGSILTTILLIHAFFTPYGDDKVEFIFLITIFLWFTVLFANFAEAIAEGRGKAQADNLRKARKETTAKKLSVVERNAAYDIVSSSELRMGDIVLVEANDIIPGDGEVVEGIASVNESAITGESAPVIRESGGDRSAVTGGTKILSDWLIIKITANPGETFIDKMIGLVEGAKRQRTPNEIALTILLASLTIIFLIVCATLLPFSLFSISVAGVGKVVSVTVLVALFVCLAPTTIGGLLSAIGIAGMDRMVQKNVIAFSGRAVESAGDVSVLLLDKTGTITLGDRYAYEFITAPNVTVESLAEAALQSSLADETPEGRSIVTLALEKYGLQKPNLTNEELVYIPFTAQTRMSGINIGSRKIRKGSSTAIETYIKENNGTFPKEIKTSIEQISQGGGTPLVVCADNQVLGVIYLKDIVKQGLKERFVALREMGIKTVMITGDNPLTAAAIAAEAGVDDFLADATPEDKLNYIRQLQSEGHLVAMTGDGTNDAPALAQADVAVAMNTGTQAAKEAANMVDLDSDPTKVIEAVEIGKQLLITRGSLTTFSLANDIAKYFAILPAAFSSTYPVLNSLNVMHLHSQDSAILSAVIFNAIIIIFLIPLALRGVKYKSIHASLLLRKNILIYGLSGLIVPFIGIKLIDMLISVL